MSEFLDELARSLAKPLPRRRAVRLLGAALVTAALPIGRTPSARAARLGSCPHNPCPKSERVCGLVNPDNVSCVAQCSNAFYPTCCEYPGYGGETDVEGTGGVCDRGPAGAVCVCKPGYECGTTRSGKKGCRCKKRCGQTCCKSGQICGSPKHSLCCESGETPCVKERGFATCCEPGLKCCGEACCYKGTQTCTDDGTCACKKGHTQKCGGDCCHPKLHKCCPGKGSGSRHCIPKERVCCGTDSCAPGQRCCRNSGNCARKGEECCGDNPYLPDAEKCCGKGLVCHVRQKCCDGKCCPPGTDCCNEGCCTPDGEPVTLGTRSTLIGRPTQLIRR